MLHPLPGCVCCLSLTCPSFSSIDDSLATGIDGATLEEVFHGRAQSVTVAQVVVEGPLLRIDPVPTPDPYNFHGNHPLSK